MGHGFSLITPPPPPRRPRLKHAYWGLLEHQLKRHWRRLKYIQMELKLGGRDMINHLHWLAATARLFTAHSVATYNSEWDFFLSFVPYDHWWCCCIRFHRQNTKSCLQRLLTENKTTYMRLPLKYRSLIASTPWVRAAPGLWFVWYLHLQTVSPNWLKQASVEVSQSYLMIELNTWDAQ